MKKKLTKILILFVLLAPLAPVLALDQATPDCGTGYMYVEQVGCVYNGGETEGTGGTATGDNGGTSTPTTYSASKLFVSTQDATNVTQTSATLRGSGGDQVANPTLKMTAYFRYSTLPIAPVFCNSVYSANMISTGDLDLGVSPSSTFYQNIYNLTPNTTYYYCAIVSNKDVIAYGGPSIVKQFHTNCLTTTVATLDAVSIRSDSATLKGNFCSTSTAKTSFQYRKNTSFGTSTPPWTKVGEVTHSIVGADGKKLSNVYGNFSYGVSGLSSETKYDFQAVVDNSGTLTTGSILNFTTTPGFGDGTGGSGGSTSSGGSGGLSSGGSGGVSSGGSGGLSSGGNSGSGTGNTSGGTSSGGSGGSNTGTWGGGSGGNGGGSGTWGSGTGSGTWTAKTGTGGTGLANWTSKNGVCTWTSATGSGTATGCPLDGSGTWNHLVLGTHATPPIDAVVHWQEGIETVFARQIVRNTTLATKYGYQAGTDLQTFAWDLSDLFARMFGYVNQDRREIRVSLPDVAAYQLVLIGDQLTVYEYYGDKIVDIRNMTTAFKSKAAYEYYFRKKI